MSDAVIKVENLSKKYIIGHQKQERYTALRDVIGNSVKSILQPNSKSKDTKEEFWALKDLDFEINQGDRVGIIGRNGAGKSTLLKVLSRITEPTTGQIKIRGRVASLLEVGTGFHPELTGRENIFLNGAILGMGKVEIKKKFDEIVAFAEVEKFLDTPVKRYSSGMYVRLAFAVAAHLEPEILIVDEVLAVGDIQFQKKCLGKMEEVGKKGRTVLFVSHNMGVITSLCNKAILLNQGRCVRQDTVEKIVAEYISIGNLVRGEICNFNAPKPNQKLKIRKLRLVDKDSKTVSEIDSQSSLFVEIDFEVFIAGKNYSISFELIHAYYGCIFTSAFWDTDPVQLREKYFESGLYKAIIQLPVKIMRGGEYQIRVSSSIPTVEILDIFSNELAFNLLDVNSPIAKSGEGRSGNVLPILNWQMNKTTEYPFDNFVVNA